MNLYSHVGLQDRARVIGKLVAVDEQKEEVPSSPSGNWD
jgi:hypothetical protein